MNHIYKTVWNAAMGTWTAVQETAKSHAKSSNSKAGRAGEQTVGVRFAFTLVASAVLLASGHVMAAEIADGAATGAIIFHKGSPSNSAAAGQDSIVIGTNTQITGAADTAQSSIAIGSTARVVAAKNAIAFGTSANSSANNAVAIGNSAKASQQSALAVGDGANASAGQSTAVGVATAASAAGASAFGHASKASADHSLAAGSEANASGARAIAIGRTASAAAADSLAMGNTASTNTINTVAIGHAAKVIGSTQLANSSTFHGVSGIAIGKSSEINNRNYGIAIGDSAFVGTYAQTRNTGTQQSPVIHYDAAREDKSDDAGRPGVAIGWKTQSTGDDSIALGNDSISTGRSSVSLGKAAYAEDTDAIAIGNSARAGQKGPKGGVSNHNSTAIGSYAQALGGWNTALGTRAYADASGSLAVGTLASSEGQRATAVGSFSFAEGLTSTALGYHTIATKKASAGTALGTGTVVDGKESGAWAAAPHGNPGQFDAAKRSYVGGTGNYAIGNQNIVGDQTTNSVAFGNNIKLGATGATLNSTSPAGVGNNIAPREEAVAYTNSRQLDGAVALGNAAAVNTNNAVALGAKSNANRAALTEGAATSSAASAAANQVYALAQAATADKDAISATVKGDLGAVSVGNATNTRQIINVAAGSEDSDAVNVAQLKAVANQINQAAGTHYYSVNDQAGDSTSADSNYNNDGATGDRSLAAGINSRATANNATAVGGKHAKATAVQALALGADTLASGTSSIAIGGDDLDQLKPESLQYYNTLTGNTITVRQYRDTTASADGAIAVGVQTQATGDLSMAVGTKSEASGLASVALGVGAQADKERAVALGAGSSTATDATQETTATVGSITYGAAAGAPGAFAGAANVTPGRQVSVGKAGAERQIKNVAPGAINANSTDAINGSQLHATQAVIGNVAGSMKNILGGGADLAANGNLTMNNIGDTGKANIHEAIKAAYDQANNPLTFAGNSGSSTRQLGQTVTISGGLETAAPSSNKNVHTFVDNATGKVDIRLANAPVFEGKVSAQGLDAGGQKITGVAKGTENNDAVNWEQLRDAVANANIANSTEVKANSPFSYVNSAGKQLVRKPDGTFAEADNPNTTYVGDDITIAALNPKAPQSTTPTRVGNVDKGIKDNDAVNVSQLKDVATALGGGAEVNPATGALTAPSYSITKTDGSSYPVANNVGQALQDLNAEVIKPMRFTGDTGTDATRKLGEKLTVKGGATGTLTENNIGVEANGTDTLTVKLAEAINLGNNGSVQTGNTTVNNDGVTITGGATGPVSLTNTGLNNGGNKITNVANGTDPNDAVNFSQLQALSSAAKTHYYSVNDAGAQGGNYDNNGATGGNALAAGVGAQATGISSTAVGHDAKATNSAAVAIGWQAEASGDHSIALGGASQGATGDLKTMSKGNSSMAIGFGTEVKEGANWSLALGDLAKVGQNAARSVAIGVQSAVEDGVTGAVALGHGAQVTHKDSVALGSGSVTAAVDNAGRDTATVGDITYSGFAATAPASMVSVGTAGAERTITNVAAGRIAAGSTDAINGSQLHATQTVIGNVAGSVKKILGGDAAVGPDGTLRMTDIGGTGKGNIHEAIEAINTTAGAGWNIGDGTGAPVGSVKPGKQVDFVAGNNTTKVEVAQTGSGDSTVTVSTAASPLQYTGTNNAGGNNAPNADQFKSTDQVTLVGSGGDTQSGVTINNVAPGSLAINSKQAVNGGQLGAVADSVRAALGGTSSLDPVTGQVTAGLDVGGTTYNNVQDALKAINTSASGGWNLQSNGGPISKIAGPNNTVNVIDGSNTKVTLNGNELKVDVVDNPTFSGPVTANGGLTVGGNLTAAPNTNVDMGNNIIHNIADGAADTDAVNVRQLRAATGGITNIGNQLSSMNNRISAVDARVTNVDNRVTQVDNRVTALAGQISGFDGKVKDVDKRVTDVANLVGENLTNPDGTKGLTVYDVAGQTRTDHTNVISALNQVKNEGTKYSHTRDNGEAPIIGPTNDSSAGALGSTAQGVNAIVEEDAVNATAMGRRARVRRGAAGAVAVGNEATAGAASAVAVGDASQALGERSVAIGKNNVVHTRMAGAMGDSNTVNVGAGNSYAVGNNNTVNTADTFVMGNNVVANVANSVYLGAGAAATAAPTAQTAGMATYNASVVDGVTHHYAGGTPVGVVSVGDVGQERRVQNVAAGLVSPTSTDAINGSQLYQTNAAIGGLNNRINANHDKAMGGIASAMASAGLPQAYLPGKSMIAMGVGAYQGRSAVAVGVSTISDNGRWIIKGSVNANNKGNVGATLGAGYQW